MRPAQKAPENAMADDFHEFVMTGFNEAGAKSAGKRRPPCRSRRCRRRFNEAGAKSAGKRPPPSGRPMRIKSFNEAGAKSAGKPATVALQQDSASDCFNEAGAKSAGKL